MIDLVANFALRRFMLMNAVPDSYSIPNNKARALYTPKGQLKSNLENLENIIYFIDYFRPIWIFTAEL